MAADCDEDLRKILTDLFYRQCNENDKNNKNRFLCLKKSFYCTSTIKLYTLFKILNSYILSLKNWAC